VQPVGHGPARSFYNRRTRYATAEYHGCAASWRASIVLGSSRRQAALGEGARTPQTETVITQLDAVIERELASPQKAEFFKPARSVKDGLALNTAC